MHIPLPTRICCRCTQACRCLGHSLPRSSRLRSVKAFVIWWRQGHGDKVVTGTVCVANGNAMVVFVIVSRSPLCMEGWHGAMAATAVTVPRPRCRGHCTAHRLESLHTPARMVARCPLALSGHSSAIALNGCARWLLLLCTACEPMPTSNSHIEVQ